MADEETAERIRERVDNIYRGESRRIFATLIRLLGDFDLAEEALHEAFRTAIEQWPRDGVLAHPRAWLVSVGRSFNWDVISCCCLCPFNQESPCKDWWRQIVGLKGVLKISPPDLQ